MRDYRFGNLITQLRTERGFSQFQLGTLLGVSDKAVSKWENGNAKPRMATCCRLADILGVSLDELLNASGHIHEKEPDSVSDSLPKIHRKTEADQQMMRNDKATQKRVELHLRTGMSASDGITSIEDYIARAATWGHSAIALTDYCVMHALPMGLRAAKKHGIKLIPGCEAMMLPDKESSLEQAVPVMLLVMNRIGLVNLNQLMTLSHLEYYRGIPCMPMELIKQYREGILVGSACDNGEIITAIRHEASDEKLLSIAAFYDYLEIQPLSNELDAAIQPRANEITALREQAWRTLELGHKLGKPVVAVSNARYLDPDDGLVRAMLQYNQGQTNYAYQPPYYFHTTEEMLAAFRFLGEHTAEEVVIDAPNRIADMVDKEINLYPDGDKLYMPYIPEAEPQIRKEVWDKAHQLFGANVPETVSQRIEQELSLIATQNSWPVFAIAKMIVDFSEKRGYVVGGRGLSGSSLVAFLYGISEVNPLPPHYRCPSCNNTDFSVSKLYKNCLDMPDKQCPCCGHKMSTDGFDIPYESFFGLHGEIAADIDMNVAPDLQIPVQQLLCAYFGKNHVFRTGSFMLLSEYRARSYARRYAEDHGMHLDDSRIEKAKRSLINSVIESVGQHDGGLMIIPSDRDVSEFMPLQYPADNTSSPFPVSHYDYMSYSIRHDVLLKMDILEHDVPWLLHEMCQLSGVDLNDVSLNDWRVLSLFTSTDALEVTSKDILYKIGTNGVNEFQSSYTQDILQTIQADSYEKLIRTSGFSHGTDIWNENVKNVVTDGIATADVCPATREDIMNDLLERGMDRESAYQIMRSVRIGKGLTNEMETAMRNIGMPVWYINSCKKIKYMFPKAHVIAYLINSLRIAWFKLYHPEAFYTALLSLYKDDLESSDIQLDEAQLRKSILVSRTENDDSHEAKLLGFQRDTLPSQRGIGLQILLEMKKRGVTINHEGVFNNRLYN